MGVQQHRRTRREFEWAFVGRERDRGKRKAIPQDRRGKGLQQPKETLMLQAKKGRPKVANRRRIVNK